MERKLENTLTKARLKQKMKARIMMTPCVGEETTCPVDVPEAPAEEKRTRFIDETEKQIGY